MLLFSLQKCYVMGLVYSPRGVSQLFGAKTIGSFPFVIALPMGEEVMLEHQLFVSVT